MDNKKQLSLREIQLAELDILSAFDEFCRQNQIKYSMAGGTLLGAVRHKGFIPWDDDIDVGMPRPDYEKFVELVSQQNYKLNEYYAVVPDRGRGANLPYLKIVDKRISVPPDVGAKVDNLWIDVLPFDGCSSNRKKAQKLLKKAKHYRHIIVYNQFSMSRFKGIKKLVYIACALYAKIYGLQRAIKNMYKLVNKNSLDKSEKMACIVWGLYGAGEIISGNSFEQTVELEFENKHFSAVHNWDEYLSGIYGDYMTPPPENKRNSHNLIAYTNFVSNEQ